MNPFGVIRQNVGGDGLPIPPESNKKRQWWVPFGPCRIPPQMVAWPFEGAPRPSYIQQFEACMVGVNGDAKVGLSVPPGPLEAPGANVAVGISAAQRTWSGRIRQAGSGLRTISYSPQYVGPALITDIIFTVQFGQVSPVSDSYMFGVSPAAGQTQFKVSRATLPIPAGSIPFFDTVYLSDNEQPGAQDGLLSQPEFIGSGGPQRQPVGIAVPWNTFSLWAMFDTGSANAGGLDWLMTFQPQTVTIGGSSRVAGGNQFNLGTYLGSGG